MHMYVHMYVRMYVCMYIVELCDTTLSLYIMIPYSIRYHDTQT